MTNSFELALSKRPPDIAHATQFIAEEIDIDWDRSARVVDLITPVLLKIEAITNQLTDAVQKQYSVTAERLAQEFLNKPELLLGINIEKNESGREEITYRGSNHPDAIRQGYNAISYELTKKYGCKPIPFKNISEGILKAHDWKNLKLKEEDVIGNNVLGAAKTFNGKLFRIPELKKRMYITNATTKEIEFLLISNDFELVTYKNSRAKFFREKV